MIIGIGSSTGGVDALLELLSHFKADCPPTFVVQHMRHQFVESFVDRLDRNCSATVSTCVREENVQRGQVKVAGGQDAHMTVFGSGQPRCRVCPGDPVSGHLPSIDVLFQSLARMAGPRVGVILTGMGRDGAGGLLAMRRSGAHTIGQDEASSTVYGMPRVAAEIGACCEVLPLKQIGIRLMELARSSEEQRRATYGGS